jgi:putative membrane protein
MRGLSSGAFMWMLTLLLSAAALCYLFWSGQLAFYVHPRIRGALAVATALIALLGGVSLWDLRQRAGFRVSWVHALFLMPLILALCCPPQMLSPEVISQKGLMGVLRGHINTCASLHGPAPVFAPEQTIIISEENFLAMMEALWEEPDQYVGREVEMRGFYYEDPTLGPDDFVLARLVMTCCAADAEVAGLLCRYPGRGQLVPGQWVLVRGRLAQMPYYNVAHHTVNNMPYIEVTSLSPSPKPAQEYIYP